jgi:hypothetical protein
MLPHKSNRVAVGAMIVNDLTLHTAIDADLFGEPQAAEAGARN